MRVREKTVGAAALVEVEGDVDMYSSPELRQTLQRLTSEKRRTIVLDLSGVDFMDSSGIATLVQTMKESRPFGGEIRLASPGGNVMRVLKLSNLTTLFRIFPTVDEACVE